MGLLIKIILFIVYFEILLFYNDFTHKNLFIYIVILENQEFISILVFKYSFSIQFYSQLKFLKISSIQVGTQQLLKLKALE